MGEYVRSVTTVVPASEARGWAAVRELQGGEHLRAAKLHLGLLGAISTMTLEVMPMWKSAATYYNTRWGEMKGRGGEGEEG